MIHSLKGVALKGLALKGAALGALAATALLMPSAAPAQDAGLPDTLIFTAYDVGSAGYNEASAIADALGKQAGTRVRIQPSGTAIGRLEPLLRGRADYAFLATETYFLENGLFDFATPDQGPKPLRVVLGRPAALAMATAADAGITDFADLKGKRYARGVGNPSLAAKCEALLAFGGLTYDDLEVVEFPTYAATMSSIAEGKADATCSTPTPSQFYELAESPRGLHWLETPADNSEGWKALEQVLPIMSPIQENVAPGLAPGESKAFAAYRYPQIVVTPQADDDAVYAFIKAVDEAFPLYKDATATMPRWSISSAGLPPTDVPFHPGAIRYLKEKGVWTEAAEAWNQAQLAREDKLQAAWKRFIADNAGLEGAEFAAGWDQARRAALADK